MKILEVHPKIGERNPGSIKLQEAWEIVDTSCKKAFGLSVADQMELDIAHFERQSEEKIYGKVPDDIETISRDYFGLRRRMLDRVRKSPETVFSTELFVLKGAGEIEPNYVICASGGVLGDPPEGYSRLMGYREPERDVEKAPYLKWWWACCPDIDDPNFLGDTIGARDDRIRFQHPKSWYSWMDFYAPTAKLLMNGRRIRTMLGPELLFAEKRIETQFGVKTEVYPSFEFPDETIDPEVLYYYYGRDTLKCDLSSETIHRPNGKVLTPWTLRRWPKLAQHVIQKMGGTEFAYFSFVRDWSAWVVSDEIFEELRLLMSPEEQKPETRKLTLRPETGKPTLWERFLGILRSRSGMPIY